MSGAWVRRAGVGATGRSRPQLVPAGPSAARGAPPLGRLGVRAPGTPITDLHQGAFLADDAAIEVGVRILVAAAIGAGAQLVGDEYDD